MVREIFIREKGKGNAINEGIRRAKNDLICVLDADCILKENALSQAVRHFDNDEVVAFGGQLIVVKEDSSLLEVAQYCKYMITFQIARRILDKLKAQCLISGAFGVFRKSVLLQMNGYDTDTVGKIWNWFFDYWMEDTRNLGIRLCMTQQLFATPESHIVSKDYCINGIGGKEA